MLKVNLGVPTIAKVYRPMFSGASHAFKLSQLPPNTCRDNVIHRDYSIHDPATSDRYILLRVVPTDA